MVRRLIRATRGDTAVELALIAPLLALMLLGITELGRVVDAWLVVHNAAREGARAGAVAYPPATTGQAAQQAAASYLSGALAGRRDITASAVDAPVLTTESIAVTASAQVQIFSPLMRQIVAPSLPVRASATMRRPG